MFGVLVNSLYVSSVSKVAGAGREGGGSIGEAMTLAQQIGGAEGETLRDTARMAFSQAHGSVLFVTGVMIALLAGAVFVSLRNASADDVVAH